MVGMQRAACTANGQIRNFGTMAPKKRVRFAIEEERCEDCFETRRKLRQLQRSLDTALQQEQQQQER